jgi:hypothetical protein
MYIQKWLSLPKVERAFFLLFEEFVKDKIGKFDFKDYYLPFTNSKFTESLEFEMWEAFEHYRVSQPYETFNNKLVFIESDINLLEINKHLLFRLLDMFKKHLKDVIYE